MNGENESKQTLQYSKEDVEIMQRIYRDGAIQRGIPGTLVGAGLGYMFLRRLPSLGRVPKAIGLFVFASLGNTLGFATYVPTARRRMMDNLPEESTLRRMLTGDIGPDDWDSPNQELAAWEPPKKQLEVFDDQRGTFDDFPEVPDSDVSFPDPEEKNPQAENATLSYQDLRNRNRNGFDSGVLPQQQQQPTVPAKKYNKYGDEIVD